MHEDGVAMRPDEIRDLVGMCTADYGELYRPVHDGEEVCNVGSSGAGVNFYARVTLAPALHPSLQFVAGHVTGVFSQHSEGQNRCVAQLRLCNRLLDHVVAARVIVDGEHE